MTQIPEIKKTREYNLFKIKDDNRRINRLHLRKLSEAINREDFLELHPIIVDKNFNVIDGQHRLETAKLLGVDLYYIQSQADLTQHLIDANDNQKKWTIRDYIDTYAAQKNEKYVEMQMMLKDTGLNPKGLLSLIMNKSNRMSVDELKRGCLQFTGTSTKTYELVDDFIKFMEYVKDKRIKPFKMFSSYNFTQAFRWVYSTSGFNKETFFNKLDNRWFDLKPQATSRNWYKLLLEIYNFHSKSGKLKPEFGLDDKKEASEKPTFKNVDMFDDC